MILQRSVIVVVVALLALVPVFALAQMGQEMGPGMRGGMGQGGGPMMQMQGMLGGMGSGPGSQQMMGQMSQMRQHMAEMQKRISEMMGAPQPEKK